VFVSFTLMRRNSRDRGKAVQDFEASAGTQGRSHAKKGPAATDSNGLGGCVQDHTLIALAQYFLSGCGPRPVRSGAAQSSRRRMPWSFPSLLVYENDCKFPGNAGQ